MSKTYQPFEPDQLLLMPPSLQEWLPKDHLVYFLRDVLEQIDLSPIQDSYEREERGYPPYHPKMMTGLLLYGYATGVRSSRHLAKHCQEDVAFRVLTANNQPDFRTISDFRKRHLEALHHVFVEILRLCRAAGLVKFAHISLDGTKIKANASKHKAMSYGRMMSDEARLRQEIKALLKEADRTDRREDRRYGAEKSGDELPEELARRESRLAKIQEAKRALEQQARSDREKKDPPSAPPASKVPVERDAKTGKERVADRAQRNFTDPDSRIMPYQKTFVQGYNAQIAVDKSHQIIVATVVTNYPKDDRHLPCMLDRLECKPTVSTLDAGYRTPENLKLLKRKKIDAYVAMGRERHGAPRTQSVRGRPPKGLSIQEKMARKLLTKKGRAIYAQRKAIAEPPIGHIKHVLGFRQFSLRGHPKVSAEWSLISAVHNLKKLFTACLNNPRLRARMATA